MEYIRTVCKIGKGESCCRYLMIGAGGFQCAKFTSLKAVLDARTNAKSMVAQGDNCGGVEENTDLATLSIKQ